MAVLLSAIYTLTDYFLAKYLTFGKNSGNKEEQSLNYKACICKYICLFYLLHIVFIIY